MNDKKINEYLSLRQEIVQTLTSIRNYRTIAYSATAAVLTYAFAVRDVPELFLIPIFIIFPLFLTEMNQIRSMLKVGSYIKVFLEEKDGFMWESRLIRYDNLDTNGEHKSISRQTPHISSYQFLVSISAILCIFFAIIDNTSISEKTGKTLISSVHMWGDIIVSLIVLVGCLFYMYKNNINYNIEKGKYIERWKMVSKNEKIVEANDR